MATVILAFLCGVVLQGIYGQTVTIVSNPAGTSVSGSPNTFDYPILSSVTLTCMVDPSPPADATFQWNTEGCYRNVRDERRCFPTGQVTQSVTGNSLLAEDAGTITCTVTIGGVDYTSGPLTLRISGIAMTGASDISTDLVGSNQIADYSFVNQTSTSDPNNAFLRCASGLGPSGTIAGNADLGGWYFNGAVVTSGCPDSPSNVFGIGPANGRNYPGVINLLLCGIFTTAEEGVYSCNMMNSSMVQQTMRVGVYFSGRTAPMIDTPSSPVRIAIGMSVTLSCTSRGSPPDTFTFMKDGMPVTPSPSFTAVTHTENMAVFQINYTINGVSEDDAGTYTCSVTNPIGSDSETITIVIAAGPPTGVRTTMLMTTSIVVIWDQSPSSDVTGYLVSYSNDASYISESDRTRSVIASGRTTTSIILTNLEEDTLYTITVQSDGSEGPSAPSDEVSIRTQPAAPSSPPRNVMVTSDNPSSLVVSWQPPPPIDHNGMITGYVIEYTRVGTTSMMSETVLNRNEQQLSDLVPFVDYSVKVAARTSIGAGPFSDAVVQISGQDRPSTAPRSLMVQSVTDTTVTLSWMVPAFPNGIISLYELQYKNCSSGSFIMLQPVNNERTRTVTGLAINTAYCFIVRAYTVVGSGPFTNEVRGRTYGPPTNVNVVILSPNSIEVTWDPPVANIDDVTGYTILYNAVESFAVDDSMSVGRSSTSAIINGLEEFVRYDIRVQAEYDMINVPTISAVRVRTWSAAPTGPPRDIRLMDTDIAMLSVSYMPPEPTLCNGDVTGYVIKYARVGSDGSQMLTVDGGNINGDRTSIIPGLVAFTSYSVQVAAVNVNGTGPFSGLVTGVSGQDRPASAPSSLTADVQSRFVTLSWMLPDTPNGIITRYEIRFNTSSVGFTDILMATIEGLLPATTYTIQIRAYTRVGAGPFSNSITVMTLPPPPEPVPTVTVPTQSISSSMLTINWMEPVVPTGNITHYTVFYLPVSGHYDCNRRKRQLAQDGEFAMNFTGTSGTLTNLNGSVTYKIQVSAVALYNGIELVGNRSSAVVITTPEGVPSAPQSLVGECMTNTSIFLLWERPDPPNGQIISYTILYAIELYDGGDPLTNSTNIPAGTFYYLLTGLRSDTQYQISVMASTIVGLGAASNLSVMTSSNNLLHTISATCNSTACDNDSGGAIAGFTAALVIALVVVVISVVLNVVLFTQLRKKTSYTPPKHSEQIYHEIKESGTLKDSTITEQQVTEKLPEPTYDLIDSGQKSHDDIKMTTNPAYDISTTVKMEDNPAYSLSGNKTVESDYM